MLIPFKKSFTDNSETLLRRAGYAKQQDFKIEKISYFRRLGSQHFPKFHIYVESEAPLTLDLHLDPKPHAYAGQRAHGGEYEGETVRAEALRVWNAINGLQEQESVDVKPAESESDSGGKGFWGSLFGS